ncbi:MAG TPA: MFS transporter [Aggregatilineales bacterium]|nr:MFS transporter [Aggregatilineales bacterium]
MLFSHLRERLPRYPRRFGWLVVIYFFNRVAASLIWPFMMIFIREQTAMPTHPALMQIGNVGMTMPLPLVVITPLLSLQAVASVLGTALIGLLMDRFGRKRVMLVGLVGYALVLIGMSGASTLLHWAILLAIYGVMHPVFMVGTNAMTADLVAPEQRVGAYALVRTISNLAIALGPAIGGFFIAQSHTIAYFIAAGVCLVLVPPVTFLLTETLPDRSHADSMRQGSGYAAVFQDRPFMAFIAVFALLEVAAALVFNLMSVYLKDQFAMPENQYGLLLTINSGMVVALQYSVTQVSKRFPALPAIAVGSLFYAVGLSIYGMSAALPAFAFGMVVMTLGELVVAPTSSSLVAEMAPPMQRARYMGLLSLTYSFGTGVGPVLGGLASEAFAPSAIWYGGGLVALAAAAGFALLHQSGIVTVGKAIAGQGKITPATVVSEA